jgi:lauroyl/myristoyl acyltransferase
MEKLNIYNDNDLMGKYNLVSAGLYNFLPDLELENHESIFKNILFHQKRGIENQKNFSHLDQAEILGLKSENDSYKLHQSIFCSFHLGSYRLINLFLIKYKIAYTLVISKRLLKEQGNDYLDFYTKQCDSDEVRFEVIDADSPTSTINMVKHLKKGRSLLIYTDGNLGTGVDIENSRNTCLINFLNQRIYARTGVAYLSYLLSVPIIPVFSYINTQKKDVLKFEEIIMPDPNGTKLEYCNYVTRLIYGNAEALIRKYPDQWEGWLYLHKIAVIDKIFENKRSCVNLKNTSNTNLIFNKLDFGLFQIGSTYYLFQKKGYKSYKIQKYLYKLLLDNIRTLKKIQIENHETLNYLIKNEVVINYAHNKI